MSAAPTQGSAPLENSTLVLADNRRIAYRRTAARGADGATVVFLGGFQSDMTGSKATAITGWATRAGAASLCFDYTGHGASSGAFEDGCVGDWAADAFDAIMALTGDNRLLLVGSSMGGWIALLVARGLLRAGRGARLAGLIGIAPAPDFTEDLMWKTYTEAQRARLMEDGRLLTPNPYDPERPTPITRRLIEDGRAQLVLRSALALPCPVRLLHGTNDTTVPTDVALRLLAHVDAADARLTLVRGADHRLSRPEDLALLIQTVETLASNRAP